MQAFLFRSHTEKILTLLFIMVLMTASPSYGVNWSEAQQDIWSIQSEVWNLWEKGDKEGRLALYHDECKIWFYNSAFPGDKTYIRREMRKYANIEVSELKPYEIIIFSNVAVIQYSLSYSALGKEFYERVTTTWIKKGDK